jgi:hypothetical protein
MLVIPMVFYIIAGIANFLIPHNKNEVRLPKVESVPSETLNPNP